MTPTIKEIAQLAGVSRGTVDRVIHGRPGVSPEVRDAVQQILADLDYVPNAAAVALKGVSRRITIGVVVPDLRNEFFEEVYAGIQAGAQHFRRYGIAVTEYRAAEGSGAELLRGIDFLLERQVDALMIQGIDDDAVTARLESLPPEFPVVTFNNDFVTTARRMCYVGEDALAAGRVAGQMMAIHLRRPGKVAIITGHGGHTHQKRRVAGFQSVMGARLPDVQLIGPLESRELESRAYRITADLIHSEPELVGLYATGGGQKSVAAALCDSARAAEIVMVGHDLLPKTVEYLQMGVVDCTITQEPYYQGYMPLEILSDYLLFGLRPAQERLYTSIDIRIKDNVAYNGFFRTLRGIQRSKG